MWNSHSEHAKVAPVFCCGWHKVRRRSKRLHRLPCNACKGFMWQCCISCALSCGAARWGGGDGPRLANGCDAARRRWWTLWSRSRRSAAAETHHMGQTPSTVAWPLRKATSVLCYYSAASIMTWLSFCVWHARSCQPLSWLQCCDVCKLQALSCLENVFRTSGCCGDEKAS